MRLLTATFALIALCFAGTASAQQVTFGNAWKEQRFSLFSSNDYALNGSSLGVKSDGSVSLLWRPLPEQAWGSRQAAWDWAVQQSVPATDLTKKGGDDRNLSLYFVFLPEQAARAAKGKGIRSLLDNPEARVLVYVWGGSHSNGAVLPSPYLGARGVTIVLEGAKTGSASERVNLAGDYQRAFGGSVTSLVGLAVSADSDDTDSQIAGTISRLRLR